TSSGSGARCGSGAGGSSARRCRSRSACGTTSARSGTSSAITTHPYGEATTVRPIDPTREFDDRDFGYATGAYATIRTIGTIRNRFAHSHQATDFDDPEVSRLCASLVLPVVTEQQGKPFDIREHTRPDDIGDTPEELYFTR